MTKKECSRLKPGHYVQFINKERCQNLTKFKIYKVTYPKPVPSYSYVQTDRFVRITDDRGHNDGWTHTWFKNFAINDIL